MPKRAPDPTGLISGRLTVESEAPIRTFPSGTRRYANCRCECGNTTVVAIGDLQRGRVQSCGCLVLKHGHARKRLHSGTYNSWRGIKKRCYQESHDAYPYYGGRGITVCDAWKNSFDAFLADMGERPEGMSLDRIDVDGNYEPSNCRWADRKTQAANKRKPASKKKQVLS